MESFFKGFFVLVMSLICLVMVAFLMAFPTKWMVNYVFADSTRIAIFGVAKIDFWRALILNTLCGFLFKSSTSSSK